MNVPDSVGEPSSKRRENGDAPTGSERPLKKARFAWQVKGKYHLKNDTDETTKSLTALRNEPGPAGTSSGSENVSRDLIGSTEQNLEILGDYLLKQDFNTLDSVVTDSEESLLKPVCLPENNTRTAPDCQQYPRYVSSSDNGLRDHRSSINSNEHIAIPMSMIISQNYEDQCITRWQAKQMAKGYVDNTINRVLDSWSRPPELPDAEDANFPVVGIAEFINDWPDYDNSVENEGILMAISAHGLQNTSASNSSNISENQHEDDTKEQTLSSPPTSPMRFEEDMSEPLNNEEGNIERSSSTESLWPYRENIKRKMSHELSHFSLNDPASPGQYFNENDSIQTDNTDYSSAENVSTNHFDFMDTAVSFAILNKGLTTFGNDYG